MDINNRRKLVKGLVAGSAVTVVSEWHKPVIRTVLLPAHASTSLATTSYQCTIESLDPSLNMILMKITPPPPLGTAVGGNLLRVGDQGGVMSQPYVPSQTTSDGSAIFSELASGGGTDGFSSDEMDIGFQLEGFCLNPEECDASCESDISPDL